MKFAYKRMINDDVYDNNFDGNDDYETSHIADDILRLLK